MQPVLSDPLFLSLLSPLRRLSPNEQGSSTVLRVRTFSRILITRRRRDLGRIVSRYKEEFQADLEDDVKVRVAVAGRLCC